MPHITCDLCETINTSTSSLDKKKHIARVTLNDLSTDHWPDQTSTISRSTDYPSALQRKRDRFTTLPISQEIASAQQTTNEECPQCHNPEMQFREAQTRGADEGSTIFYTCPKCMHKFNTND
jgi:DNA-directed RNA polymerase I subunit RPA12